MNYCEAEGPYNPPSDPASRGEADDLPPWCREGLCRPALNAQSAVRAALDELALLAGIATAAPLAQTLAQLPATSGR